MMMLFRVGVLIMALLACTRGVVVFAQATAFDLVFLSGETRGSDTVVSSSKPAATSTVATDLRIAPWLGTSTAGTPEGLTSCFDYYAFNSVSATVAPSLEATVPGATIAFQGALSNGNNYPTKNIVVYAKVFHVRGSEKEMNGADVIDFFPVTEKVMLRAGEGVPISFTWTVPAYAGAGDYQLATYVVAADRFDLSGLVFTDDVVSGRADFRVVGDSAGAVRFVRNGVFVQGVPYRFAALPQSVTAGGAPIEITTEVENTTDEPFVGSVTWNIYYWSSVHDKQLLATETSELEILPHASTIPSVTVHDNAHAVYYVEGSVVARNGMKSIVGIRIAREDVQEQRLGFVAMDGTTAVACVHAVGGHSAENGEVIVMVTSDSWRDRMRSWFDAERSVSAHYVGVVPREISALTADVPWIADAYTVTATLTQDGQVIDKVTFSYTCEELGTACPPPGEKWRASGIALLVLLMMVAPPVWWYVRRRSISEDLYEY